MSHVERNKGRLFPIEDRTLTVDELENPWDHGLMRINHEIYRVQYDVKGDDDLSFADVEVDNKGVIEFHTLHYNGGGSLEEVIESALKRNANEDQN